MSEQQTTEAMPFCSRAVAMLSPDAMGAAASHIEREYGGYGYRLGVEASNFYGGGVVFVQHFDGSTFRLAVDRYGNVRRMPDRRELDDAINAYNDTRAEVEAK